MNMLHVYAYNIIMHASTHIIIMGLEMACAVYSNALDCTEMLPEYLVFASIQQMVTFQ